MPLLDLVKRWWVCPTNGVYGVYVTGSSPTAIRSAKVTAKGFRTGFTRVPHRVCSVPVGYAFREMFDLDAPAASGIYEVMLGASPAGADRRHRLPGQRPALK